MKLILKILCSIPVVLLTLYYLPFLGVCLIIARFFIYQNKNKYYFSISLISVGLILLIPKVLSKIKGIPYISTILSSDIYPKLIPYSKRLITIGIIFLVLSYIFKNITDKVGNKIKDYIEVDNEWYDKLFKIMVEDKSLEKFDEVIRRYLDEGIEYDPYINEGSTK